MPQTKTPLLSPSQTLSQATSSPNPTQTLQPVPESMSKSPLTVDPTSSWKTYRNEQYGFELKYPPTWRVWQADNEGLWIAHMQSKSSITVAVLDFRPPSTGKFQDWVNERPDTLMKFRDRDALRWYTRGIPTPTFSKASKFFGTEHFIIPSSKTKGWAVAIDMTMEDIRTCSDCVQLFEQLAHSLNFGGMD